MTFKNRILKLTGFEPLAHRPPLSPRFWIYCATAYMLPVVVQVGLPEDPGLTDELVWLVTLAPAFLLSLHYGLKGAFAGLVMGTALFMVVQTVVALNYTPDDWRITVPIYIAYGSLAISVGWLSEQLHGYYRRVVKNERMASIGQFAVTVRHELNNALTAIVTESQIMQSDESDLTESQRVSAQNVYTSAMRIAETVKKLESLAEAPVTTYFGNITMLDTGKAATQEPT